MARPKKDGHSINVYLDERQYKNLTAFATMSGMTKTSILEEALKRFLAPYCEDEEIKAVPALLIKGNSELDKKMAENEGREVTITETPCFVLSQETVFNQPYYRIYEPSISQMMKVPIEHIRFPSKS